jgi:hypothetical protein
MKRLILLAITLTSALSVLAQGTVVFNNRIAGTGITHVYSGPLYRTGNGSADVPPGPTDYRFGFTLIGTVGGMTGSTTFAQLIGANGAFAPESSLLPSTSPATTFRTGAAAGFVAGTTATFNNIPPDAGAASFELAVWDNSSGLFPTWTQASVGIAGGLIAGGRSAEFNLTQIGGTTFTPPNIVSSIPGLGLQSFVAIVFIPEPTTIALASLGAAALFIFRRRR